MIFLEGVTKVYNEGLENEIRAVRELALEIEGDKTTVLQGPSGSGKTTLLTLIGCLARPTSGRIGIEGEVVSGLPERFMTEVRRKTFGFVFQRLNLIRGLTAIENVMLPAYPLGLDHGRLHERATDLLDMLDIPNRAGTKIEHLSGGEAQRVAIARALVNDPRIVIADEPTANLDSSLTKQFLRIIERLREERRTVLLASHDPRICGADIVDRVVTMEDGTISEGGVVEGSV
ncbi:MAG: ABC transporter ATP-binding protein [Gemmatimonadetes bacterium]|nr:ABC transporter ATP-binding protein [Gemmatimonadota bacterium]